MIAALAFTGAFLAATASATVRTPKVEVGERVAIHVKVTARPGALVSIQPPNSQPPVFTVEAGGQRLVQADADGTAELTWHLVPWDAAPFVVPGARVEVNGISGLLSNPVKLEPFNPLGANAAAQQPKDVRDIRPFPVSDPLIWVWALIAGVFAGLAFLALRGEKKKTEPAAPPLPVAPRRESLADAMERVKRIVDAPPTERAKIREAHFTIAEAVRRFVEERWEIPATRQTTEEFLRDVSQRSTYRGGGMSLLPVVLEACDRVKWSGEGAGPQDTLEVARLALDFFAASRGAVRGLGGDRSHEEHA